jgi:hypothetical protein
MPKASRRVAGDRRDVRTEEFLTAPVAKSFSKRSAKAMSRAHLWPKKSSERTSES